MEFTSDPKNSVIDRIRLVVGDTDNFDIDLENSVYQYVIDENTTDSVVDEVSTSIQILKYLVAKSAKLITEKSGGEFAKWEQRHKQYKELLDDMVNGGSLSSMKAGKPFAGGIEVDDIVDNIYEANTNKNPLGYKINTYPDFKFMRKI